MKQIISILVAFFIISYSSFINYSFATTADQVSFDADNIEIKSALQLIANLAKLNIIVKPKVKGKINIHLRNTTYKDIINHITNTHNLSSQIKDKTMVIDVNIPTKIPPQIAIAVQIIATTDDFSDLFSANIKKNSSRSSKSSQSLPITASIINKSMLSLELKASQAEGKSKIIANPRLITVHNKPASISTGTEFPYMKNTKSRVKLAFKPIILKLEITPKVITDDKVRLKLQLTQSQPGKQYQGAQGLTTTNLTTSLQLEHNATVVIGGIYSEFFQQQEGKTPYLHRIPILGKLFNSSTYVKQRAEILIFVTPEIFKVH